ncbi:hypothetical protein GHT06_017645 [Daphnia sinensis]|uniref:Uncharacterized protein n=1 Tax=Daphnia sinensis TaxID=1820382 RepID=A0AAD5L2Q7_9CRUS|nr:hypothetical protein GHT06_017645 [Daphnia sinensis]
MTQNLVAFTEAASQKPTSNKYFMADWFRPPKENFWLAFGIVDGERSLYGYFLLIIEGHAISHA